jgi:hypothetical protein
MADRTEQVLCDSVPGKRSVAPSRSGSHRRSISSATSTAFSRVERPLQAHGQGAFGCEGSPASPSALHFLTQDYSTPLAKPPYTGMSFGGVRYEKLYAKGQVGDRREGVSLYGGCLLESHKPCIKSLVFSRGPLGSGGTLQTWRLMRGFGALEACSQKGLWVAGLFSFYSQYNGWLCPCGAPLHNSQATGSLESLLPVGSP